MTDTPNADAAPLVAFDFDGTLTTKDSFTAFLAWRIPRARYLAGLVRLIPDLLAYGVHRDRGRLKAAAVRVFLRGLTRDAVEDEARAFAGAVRLFRPDAVATWQDWRARGATLAIVTASPTTVVAPFARMLGADVLIGTELAFDDQGRATGRFDGANCRGPEKVARLKAHFGNEVRLDAAYGDTGGDAEMLAMATEKGFRVFTGRP